MHERGAQSSQRTGAEGKGRENGWSGAADGTSQGCKASLATSTMAGI